MKMEYQTLFAYQNHTNQRLLRGAAGLSEADYREHPGYGLGSVHDLFVHLLSAGRVWRAVLLGERPSRAHAADFPDIASLQAAFDQEEAAWRSYLDGLEEADLQAAVTLRGERSIPRWRILQHLILHGMQHAAEIAHLLTLKGQSPGDIDFIFFEG
jgi:uncharacterized damage-inducible protein DinB